LRDRRLPARTKGGDLAGSPEHFIDFAGVQFFGVNHLSGVFFDDDRPPFCASQQFAIEAERFRLGVQRLSHDRVDVVFVAVKQRADRQRRVFPKQRDHFPRLLRMG